MARHEFDGRWRYFEKPNGSNSATRGDDLILDIPDEGGAVQSRGSSHAGFPLSGHARADSIELTRTERGNIRTLNGTRQLRLRVGNTLFLVIAGTYDDSDSRKLQKDGDWVITKP